MAACGGQFADAGFRIAQERVVLLVHFLAFLCHAYAGAAEQQ